MIPKLKNPIGTSSHVVSKYPIHQAITLLGRTGYDAIEIWAEELELQLKNKTTSIAKIKSEIKKQKMTGSVHAPLKSLVSEEKFKLNICSKKKKLRDYSIKKNLEALDYAKKIGFEVITVHPGHTDYDGEKADRKFWQLQINALKKITKKAEKLNLKTAMELMQPRKKEFILEPPQIKRILKAVKSKNLGITFDLTHAYQHGTKKPIEFLDSHRKDIFHVHISGHSKVKNHVPFYMSNISSSYLDKVLKDLVEYHKDIIIIEGSTDRLEKQTKKHQAEVVKKNLNYIHKELKSLHLI